MAGNFNNGYPGRGQGNRGGYGGQARYEPPKKIEAMPLPAEYVDMAEEVVRDGNWSRRITTSKIRRLFSLLVEVYNDEVRRTADTLTRESVARLHLARVRMLYEAGRDERGTKQFLEAAKLVEYLKGIGDSRARLLDYFHYMEALVAYHRFYGGREG